MSRKFGIRGTGRGEAKEANFLPRPPVVTPAKAGGSRQPPTGPPRFRGNDHGGFGFGPKAQARSGGEMTARVVKRLSLSASDIGRKIPLADIERGLTELRKREEDLLGRTLLVARFNSAY